MKIGLQGRKKEGRDLQRLPGMKRGPAQVERRRHGVKWRTGYWHCCLPRGPSLLPVPPCFAQPMPPVAYWHWQGEELPKLFSASRASAHNAQKMANTFSLSKAD